jgi:hypothetical protein
MGRDRPGQLLGQFPVPLVKRQERHHRGLEVFDVGRLLSFPAPAPIEPWYQQRDNVVDMTGWAMYAIGALLGWFAFLGGSQRWDSIDRFGLGDARAGRA